MNQNQEQINNINSNGKPPVAQIAVMVAVAVICGLISLYVPVVMIVTSLLYPLPFAILVYRFGIRWGVIALLAVTLIIALFSNPLLAGLLTLQYGLMGLFFGQCFRKEVKPLHILVGGVIFAAVLLLATLVISALVAGLSPIQMYDAYNLAVTQVMDNILVNDMYNDIPVEQYKANLVEAISNLIPSILVIYAMIIAALEYLILVKIMRRLGYMVTALPPFENWRLNWQLIWGFIIAIILNALGNLKGWSSLSQITTNIIYVYYPLLFICGVSFCYWLLKRFSSVAVKVIFVVVAIFFFNLFIYFLLIVAVVEPIINLREKLTKVLNKK